MTRSEKFDNVVHSHKVEIDKVSDDDGDRITSHSRAFLFFKQNQRCCSTKPFQSKSLLFALSGFPDAAPSFPDIP